MLFRSPINGLALTVIIHLISGQWVWGLGLGITAFGLGMGSLLHTWPGLARPVYVVWYSLVVVTEVLVSSLLLTLTYFLVICPAGLIMRALGRDPLRRKIEPESPSYWDPMPPPPPPNRYFKTF